MSGIRTEPRLTPAFIWNMLNQAPANIGRM